MLQAKISEEGVRYIIKRVRITLYCVTLGAGMIGALGGTLTSDSGPAQGIWIFLPILAGVMIFISERSVRRQREMLASFEVHIDEQGITKLQRNFADVEINKEDITEIIRSKKGHLQVRTASPQRFIAISRYIENRSEVEAALGQLHPISDKEPRNYNWLAGLIILVYGTLGTVFFVSEKPLTILISGSFFALAMLLSLAVAQWSKLIDKRSKQRSWFLLLVVSVIVVRMIVAWKEL